MVSVAGLNGSSPQLKAVTPHEIQVLNNAQNTLPGNIPLRHAARLWDVFQARCILPPSHAAPSGRWQPERDSQPTNRDAGFQPEYWTSPCITEAEGAGS